MISSYESPLASRYASHEISFLFSPKFKYTTWRRLWIALAKGEKSLGLPISDKQIHELESHLHDLNLERAAYYEKEFRHDVMAHIHAYGEQCPEAKSILHLGATSCFITDNTDLIQIKEGLKILRAELIQVIRALSTFALAHAQMPTLSFTHYQPAQPTTVGKRACLWIQDLMMDLHDLEQRLEDLAFLGLKGATGTQASFLSLFNHDSQKVKRLEEFVAKEMGFTRLIPISGQTYTRKQDLRIFNVLSGIAVTAHKFGTDMRLLANLKEMEEPLSQAQIGSSAMPYKRNPMRCERMCGLARFLISLQENPAYTASTQWLERTLDDSSNRRLCIPEAFLCADALLHLFIDVTSNLVIYPKVILKHLQEELPFLATENILMAAVKKGKDRQELHEHLRKHSLEAAKRVKEEGEPCDLLERIRQDPSFGFSASELAEIVRIDHFIGRAKEQVEEFLHHDVDPLLKHYKDVKPPSFSIQL